MNLRLKGTLQTAPTFHNRSTDSLNLQKEANKFRKNKLRNRDKMEKLKKCNSREVLTDCEEYKILTEKTFQTMIDSLRSQKPAVVLKLNLRVKTLEERYANISGVARQTKHLARLSQKRQNFSPKPLDKSEQNQFSIYMKII